MQAALDALRAEHTGFDARFAAAQAVPTRARALALAPALTLTLTPTLTLTLALTLTQPVLRREAAPLYLPVSRLHLRCICPISPLYLPYISPTSAQAVLRREEASAARQRVRSAEAEQVRVRVRVWG